MNKKNTGKKQKIFKGISIVSIDDKGRLAIPSKYRDTLKNLCGGKMVVTVDPDGCLLLYPSGAWDGIEEQLLLLPSMDDRSRFIQRLLLGHATECELDGQGRLLLSSALREVSGLGNSNGNGNAILLGQGAKFELWNQKAWDKCREKWLRDSKGGTEVHKVLEELRL